MQELHCRPLFQADPLGAREISSCRTVAQTRFEPDDPIKQELHRALSNHEHDSSQLWSSNTKKNNNSQIDLNEYFKPEYIKFFGFIGMSIAGIVALASVIKSFWNNEQD